MDWPTDFVWGEPLPEPAYWQVPGVVLFFNLECAGCVSRAVPFLKELHAEFGEHANLLAIHTALGHRLLSREQVAPTVLKFARDYARLPVPVALDIDGQIAEHWHTEGSPHWLAFSAGGRLLRSVYGSQDNAQTRLRYLLEEERPPTSGL